MNLKDIKRPYDVVLSLGYWCGIAGHLKNYNLRRFSSPFDWVLTPSLADINRLLKNRFEDFMDIKNMKLVNFGNYGTVSVDVGDNDNDFVNNTRKTYVIQDTKYNITSVHDFLLIPNQSWILSYPSYKEKLHYRINRFLKKIENSKSTLFVRYDASYNEVIELQSILLELTKKQIHILIVNPVEGLKTLQEKDWGLDGITCVEIPLVSSVNVFGLTDIKTSNGEDWEYILKGITVNN